MPRPDLPDGHICHVTDARIRIRIPERRRDSAFFEEVRSRLSSWPSIDQVDVNPITASVLIHFKDAAALFSDHQEHNDMFRLIAPDPATFGLNGEPIVDTARKGLAAIDRGLKNVSGGRTDLRALAFLGLVGAGLVQLAAGRISAPAVTIFWYAGDLLGIWRPSDRQALVEQASLGEDDPSGPDSAAA